MSLYSFLYKASFFSFFTIWVSKDIQRQNKEEVVHLSIHEKEVQYGQTGRRDGEKGGRWLRVRGAVWVMWCGVVPWVSWVEEWEIGCRVKHWTPPPPPPPSEPSSILTPSVRHHRDVHWPNSRMSTHTCIHTHLHLHKHTNMFYCICGDIMTYIYIEETIFDSYHGKDVVIPHLLSLYGSAQQFNIVLNQKSMYVKLL